MRAKCELLGKASGFVVSAPRLLAIADAGNPTGFERVAREILTPLHTSGRFDVTMLGDQSRSR